MSRSALPFVAFAALFTLPRCETAGKSTTTSRALETNLVEQTVHWPLDQALDRAALAKLPAEARVRVASARMPVLVPNDARLLERATIVAEDRYFAFSATYDGLSLSVHGTRFAHVYDIPPMKGDRTVRGTSAFVTEVERVREASWIENGVSYVVDVECEREDDARCASDELLLRTTEALSYIGPERGGAR